MEEVDTISLELEEKESELELKKQIDQYNIYINFLNDYYSNSNPQPVKFGESFVEKTFWYLTENKKCLKLRIVTKIILIKR